MGQRGNSRSIMYLCLRDVPGLDLGGLGRWISRPCFELYTGIAPQKGLIKITKVYTCFSLFILPCPPSCCSSYAG